MGRIRAETVVFERSVYNLDGADTMNAVTQPQLFSVRTAATMLGVGRTTAWKFVTDGTLETVHIGGRRMIRAQSLHKLIAEGTSAPMNRDASPIVRHGKA